METIELVLWIIGILAFFLITTFLLKRFKNVSTFYVGSMIKTKRFLPLLDKFSRHKRILNLFSDIGLVLGFGAIAVDFIIGRKLGRKMRVLVFIASTIVLFEFFNLVFQILLANPFIEQYNFFLSLGFGLMGFSGFLLVSLAAYSEFVISSALIGQKTCPGVAPLIPGVQIPGSPLNVPLHGWVSILIILVVHEGMHGVLMRKAKMAIKSAGVLLLGLFPIGAFVEPWEENKITGTETEEELIAKKLENQRLKAHLRKTGEILVSKGPEREQLRVFAAGPTANIATVLVVFAIAIVFSFLVSSAFGAWINAEYKNNFYAMKISSVDQNVVFCGKAYPSPALGKLDANSVIEKINGVKIDSLDSFSTEFNKIGKNPYTLTVTDINGLQKTVSLAPNELGFHGYHVIEEFKPGAQFSAGYKALAATTGFIDNFLLWLLLLSLVVGIANFLPLEPFDGGKIVKMLLLPYLGFLKMPKEKKEKLIHRVFLWIVLILLAMNALPFFL